jgi:hypothetical protein
LPGESQLEQAMQALYNCSTWNTPRIQWFNTGSFSTPNDYKFSLNPVENPRYKDNTPDVLLYSLGNISRVSPETWGDQTQYNDEN